MYTYYIHMYDITIYNNSIHVENSKVHNMIKD